MDIYTTIGLVGVACYVATYIMLQLGLLDGNGVVYSVGNVVAASLVLVSLTSDFNLASAAIQVIWIVVGLAGLCFRFLRRPSAEAMVAAVGVSVAAVGVSVAAASRTTVVKPIRLQPDRAPGGGRIMLNLLPDQPPQHH